MHLYIYFLNVTPTTLRFRFICFSSLWTTKILYLVFLSISVLCNTHEEISSLLRRPFLSNKINYKPLTISHTQKEHKSLTILDIGALRYSIEVINKYQQPTSRGHLIVQKSNMRFHIYPLNFIFMLHIRIIDIATTASYVCTISL